MTATDAGPGARARRWIAAWRVALRSARREAARAKLRTALVVLLVGLPIAGATALDVAYTTRQRDPGERVAERLGTTAQAWIDPLNPGGWLTWRPGGDLRDSRNAPARYPTETEVTAAVARALPAGDRLVPRTTMGAVPVRGNGRRGVWNLTEWDYRATPGVIHTRTGRAPAAPGEGVVDQRTAEDNHLGVGERLTLPGAGPGGQDADLVIVGTFRRVVSEGNDSQLILFPGTVPPGSAAVRYSPWGSEDWFRYRDWYVTGPVPVREAQLRAVADQGLLVLSRAVPGWSPGTPGDRFGGPGPSDLVVPVVAAVLLLLQITLMAGPALAVGARRNRRALALLAASGGDPRQLRRHVLASGLLAGLAGGLGGTAAGVAIQAVVNHVAASRAVDADQPPLDVRPLHLGLLVLTGAATAVAAALVPARQAARADVVAVLAGRPAVPPTPRRVPVAGLVLAAAGSGLALWAAVTGKPDPFVVGVGLGEVGLVTATGALVVLAGRTAGRLPLVPRLALRDAARHRSRTAPAVAAAMAAVAGGVTVLLTASAVLDHDERLSGREAVPGTTVVTGLDLDEAAGIGMSVDDWAAVRTAVTAKLPAGASAPLRELRDGQRMPRTVPPGRCTTTTESGAFVMSVRCPATWTDGREELDFDRPGWVDDGTALDIVLGGTDPDAVAALRAGRTVVWDPGFIGPDGTVRLSVPDRAGQPDEPDQPDPPTHQVAVPAYLARGPKYLTTQVLSPAAARTLGLETRQAGLVVAGHRIPTEAEERAARTAYEAAAGVFAGTGDLRVVRGARGTTPRTVILLGMLAVALVVTLAGTLTAAGLAAAEGRPDRQVLSAVGASPGLGRRLAAAQALVISGLGSALGTAAGAAAGVALVGLMRARDVAAAGSSPLPPESSLYRFVVPAWQILLLAVGVPLVTMAVAAAFAPRGTRTPPRRPR